MILGKLALGIYDMAFDVKQDIEDKVRSLFNESIEADYSRYLSFDYCFKFFQDNFINNNNIDFNLSALNLACYLSSWGMYRGSTFALQVNYKIYENLLEKLHNKSYQFNPYKPLKCNIDSINECFSEINTGFSKITVKDKNVELTATFTTKIMLGIFGITPAFDRFFIDGLSTFNDEIQEHKFTISNFKNTTKFKECYMAIINFYKDYQEIIDNLSENLVNDKTNTKLPPMRIIDMYFWKLGKSEENFEISDT